MFTTVNALGLHAQVTGSGHPLILLHGLTGGIDTWRLQIPALSKETQVIAIDSRGFGGSETTDLEYSIEDLADDVIQLMDHLSLEKASIMGLSMGGGIAQRLALDHPDRIVAIVLASTSSAFPTALRDRFLRDALVAESDGMQSLSDTLTERWLSPDYQARYPRETAELRRELSRIDPKLFAIRCRANASRDFTSHLPEITCPTLFIGGSKERESEDSAEEYKKMLPNCEVRLIEGASHFIHQEQATEFNRAVIEFLGRNGLLRDSA